MEQPKEPPVQCKGCGKWIKPEQRRLCTYCEEDIMEVLVGNVKPKSPPLCAKCFEGHEAEHIADFAAKPLTAEALAEEARQAEERLRKEFGE